MKKFQQRHGDTVVIMKTEAIKIEDQEPTRGARNQQIGQAGEHFVVAELNRRGGYAVSFAGNMPEIDVFACNHDRSRTVHIQVKTKRSGTWHTAGSKGRPIEKSNEAREERDYWIFVDLGKDNENPPKYWVVPDSWLRNDIHEKHTAYLDYYMNRHDGKKRKSDHHGIDEKHIVQWEGRWEILGILP